MYRINGNQVRDVIDTKKHKLFLFFFGLRINKHIFYRYIPDVISFYISDVWDLRLLMFVNKIIFILSGFRFKIFFNNLLKFFLVCS